MGNGSRWSHSALTTRRASPAPAGSLSELVDCLECRAPNVAHRDFCGNCRSPLEFGREILLPHRQPLVPGDARFPARVGYLGRKETAHHSLQRQPLAGAASSEGPIETGPARSGPRPVVSARAWIRAAA
jgi:hypothetical protein